MRCTDYGSRLFVECVEMTTQHPTPEPRTAILDLIVLVLAGILLAELAWIWLRRFTAKESNRDPARWGSWVPRDDSGMIEVPTHNRADAREGTPT